MFLFDKSQKFFEKCCSFFPIRETGVEEVLGSDSPPGWKPNGTNACFEQKWHKQGKAAELSASATASFFFLGYSLRPQNVTQLFDDISFQHMHVFFAMSQTQK